MKEIWIEIIKTIPLIFTAVVSLITSLMVNQQKKKQKEVNERDKKFHKEMEERDNRIYYKIDELKREVNENEVKRLKKVCTDGFTDLINGVAKTSQQIQNLVEDFDTYKSKGGDSYVDDLHAICVERGLIK